VIVVVMGPSGVGKTTVGSALAAALGWEFIEGDDLHPPENIAKMRHGIALSHADRMPWLSALRRNIEAVEREGRSAVIACSALTGEYRAMLSAGTDTVRFVYLHGERALLERRLRQRSGHFAGPELLSTQLATLEDPGETALTLDASASPEALVSAIREAFHV
jgi:gluconokinase